METKEYFEKVMQDFNQNRRGRNLRKYCSDEGYQNSLLYSQRQKYIFMMNITDDPDFVASWQKVEEALKRLDQNQVERLFAEQHATLKDFHQALTKELERKAADLESAVAFLKEENKAIETFKIKSETKKLREERERMNEELLQKKHELDQLKTTPYPHERWG